MSFMRRWRVPVLCVTFLVTISCGSKSQPEKWIIPENYTGWLRVDYAVAGAPPLPMEGTSHVVRMPKSGRLRSSSPYNPSVDNEYFVLTEHGLQRLEHSKWDVVRSQNTIRGFAVQNVFGFFTLVNGKAQTQGKCVFVGTNTEFKDNGRDCRSWEFGQSEPPEFQRHIGLPKADGGAKD